jgi:hypothetical protein
VSVVEGETAEQLSVPETADQAFLLEIEVMIAVDVS